MQRIGKKNGVFPAISTTAGIFAVSFALLASFWGCSDDKTALGNSAESGNPEVAIRLDGDFPEPVYAYLVSADYDQFDVNSKNGIVRGARLSEFSVSVPPGLYSLEASDSAGLHVLLKQNLEISGDTALTESLSDAGSLELRLDSLLRNADISVSADLLEGANGSVSVLGSTFLSTCKVQKGTCLVSHLPAGDLTLRVRFVDKNGDTVDFKIPSAEVVSGDTSVVGGFFPDSTVYIFVAPLALPADADTALAGYVSDIPLAFELDSTQLDFEEFSKMQGRWDVMRISADGVRSKNLSIAKAFFDADAKKAVFWVNVDSLNFGDSLELAFKHNVEEAFAAGVFPTNREYASVWHFDALPLEDVAEKSTYTGEFLGTSFTDGAVGNGLLLDSNASVTILNSAASDSLRKTDLNFAFADGFGFSAWVKLNSLQKEQTIFKKGDSQYALRFVPDSGFIVEFFHEANTLNLLDSLDSLGYRAYVTSGDSLLQADEWMYLAFGKKKNVVTFFVNGQKIPVAWQQEAWNGSRDESKNVTIGPFDGSIDELMLSGSLRSDAWNYLTYLNQRPENPWPKFFANKLRTK